MFLNSAIDLFNQAVRRHLALLLLHERWVLYRAKANVPNKRSRHIEELSWSSLSR